MSRLAWVLDEAPTPITYPPPADCPWCTTGTPEPFYADPAAALLELAGYHCPACEWAVGLCRYCGWPRYSCSCRIHFRPVTDVQGLVIGDDRRRHALVGMPPA